MQRLSIQARIVVIACHDRGINKGINKGIRVIFSTLPPAGSAHHAPGLRPFFQAGAGQGQLQLGQYRLTGFIPGLDDFLAG